MKKIIATALTVAGLMLGGITSPAYAGDPCELLGNCYEASPTKSLIPIQPYTPTAAEMSAVREQVVALEAQVLVLKYRSNDFREAYLQQLEVVAQQQATITKLQRVAERRKATIQRLRAKLARR